MTRNCGVRVTYKRTLLPRPINSREPEFKPVSTDPAGGLCTRPEGQIFMDSLPPLAEEPLREAWAPAESNEAGEGAGTTGKQAWHKRKVFSDILNHTSKEFSDAQRDQWRALESFHDKYPTSDVVPTL
eukprot:6179577-Pleurochrysis_carterae.AAC.1